MASALPVGRDQFDVVCVREFLVERVGALAPALPLPTARQLVPNGHASARSEITRASSEWHQRGSQVFMRLVLVWIAGLNMALQIGRRRPVKVENLVEFLNDLHELIRVGFFDGRLA